MEDRLRLTHLRGGGMTTKTSFSHLRQLDLNLLIVLSLIAEENSISRAAKRLHQTQSAVSRALQRMREQFDDELLVRTGKCFKPTPKGRRLLTELASTLPRLDYLLANETFDPKQEDITFRVLCSDYALTLVASVLRKDLFPESCRVSIDFVSREQDWQTQLIQGRADLAIGGELEGQEDNLLFRPLVEDRLVCVAAYGTWDQADPITLAEFESFRHIGIADPLLKKALHRAHLRVFKPLLTVPNFSAALNMVTPTGLLATVPQRLVDLDLKAHGLAVRPAPVEFGPIHSLLFWHTRRAGDSALEWLIRIITAGTLRL